VWLRDNASASAAEQPEAAAPIAEVVMTGSRIVNPAFTPLGVDAGLLGKPPPRVDPHLARSSCDGNLRQEP
jgi:hypothetical protein